MSSQGPKACSGEERILHSVCTLSCRNVVSRLNFTFVDVANIVDVLCCPKMTWHIIKILKHAQKADTPNDEPS